MVIAGIQQPSAEAGAVWLHHRYGESGPGQFEHAHTPGACHEKLGMAVPVVIGCRSELVVSGIEQPYEYKSGYKCEF